MKRVSLAIYVFGILFFSLMLNADVSFQEFSLVRYFGELTYRHGWRNFRQVNLPADGEFTVTTIPAYKPIFEEEYPRSSCLIAGMNDTLTLRVQFVNKSDSVVTWSAKTPDTWVAPRLFDTKSDFNNDAPAVDSSDLEYSVRFWTHRDRKLSSPDSIPKGDKGLILYVNVWGIPEGDWVLSSALTNNAPEGIVYQVDGMEFSYAGPIDAQDSVNAWLGCAHRAFLDHNYIAAIAWTDTALSIFPHSGPAWWKRAICQMFSGDSIATVQAFDSALYFFDGPRDALLPDTTKEVAPVDRLYMRAARPSIQKAKDSYLSKGNWYPRN